jgi:hypothetical protein
MPLERPCIVVAGGREPAQWEAYGAHRYLATNGCLKCCDRGGCWKSRVIPLGDGDDKDKPDQLCVMPVGTKSGQIIPKCLDLIKAQDVIRAMEQYLEHGKEYKSLPKITRKQAEILKKKFGKVGKNTLCPCGSGKKYKLCCIDVNE